MKRLAAALGLIAVTSAPASADKWSQKRQSLVDLAIAPDDYIGQTKRVFCPIETAVVGFVVCYMSNEAGNPIGSQALTVKGVPASEYTKILNACGGEASATIREGCFYEIDVIVRGPKGSATLEATKLYPVR